MRVITKDEFLQSFHQLSYDIKRGSVIIYPTDTVYGLGCNAMIDKAVQKVRALKAPWNRPFSVIVPSVAWIREHCVVHPSAEEWMKKLPGPYTLVFKLKDKSILSGLVTNNADTLGVRIPDHWISKIVADIGYPIVTTVANHMGETVVESPEDLPIDMRSQVDYVIYEGHLHGRPSQIIDLTHPKSMVMER